MMKKLTMLQALHQLKQPGARLIRLHTARDGCEFWITPATRVPDELAAQLQRHPYIRAGEDGLWPGHDQTWRWESGQ
jgi:hypothetical protein